MLSSANKTISYPSATICDKLLSPQHNGMCRKELKTLKLKSEAGSHCLHCYWYKLRLNLSPSFNFLIYTVDLLVLLIKRSVQWLRKCKGIGAGEKSQS